MLINYALLKLLLGIPENILQICITNICSQFSIPFSTRKVEQGFGSQYREMYNNCVHIHYSTIIKNKLELNVLLKLDIRIAFKRKSYINAAFITLP